MDLLAPCRNCLQCLPFFSLSPRPRVAAAGAPPSSSPHSPGASKATPTDPAQTDQTLPSPPPAAPPAVQEQDLYHPPIKAEEETPATKEDEEYDALPNSTDESYSALTECEAVPTAGILIAPPVSSPPRHGASPPEEAVEDNKATTVAEAPMHVPFINDITFSPSGFRPLEAAITPSPFGASYSAGQSPPHDQIRLDHRVEPHGDENLFNSAHHEHDHSHHGHDHSHHGHMDSHDGHVLQHSPHVHTAFDYEGPHPDQPQHGHAHAVSDYEGPHSDSPQHSHVHTASKNDVAHVDPPSDDAEVQEDVSHHDFKHQSHVSTSVDDVEEASSGHTSLDVEIGDISPFPPLEVSQSTPDLDMEATPPLDASQSTPPDLEVVVGGENSGASHTNGASALLEAYHSEPVVLPVGPDDDDDEAQSELFEHIGSRLPARRRRRDHFRDQLKGFKQQIKQGGLHLKEEGNKHMQTIIENMNKQAQQIEQSGSFFIVPRANNN